MGTLTNKKTTNIKNEPMKEYQTQQEQIDALGGKIVVKRRDYEAADRITQRELSRNEATIVRLRDQVKRKRKALAAMLHKDKDVVKNALSDPKTFIASLPTTPVPQL